MRQSRRGFSLIELTVIIILMALMAGTVLFVMGAGARPGYMVRSLAQQTAGRMEQAKLIAGLTGRLVRIEYDLDMQVLKIFSQRELKEDDEDDFDPEAIEDYLVPVGSLEFGDLELGPDRSPVWLDYVETYDGVKASSGVVVVDIRPKGTSIGHIVVIRTKFESQSDDVEYYSVELNPVTSQTRIYNELKEVIPPERD